MDPNAVQRTGSPRGPFTYQLGRYSLNGAGKSRRITGRTGVCMAEAPLGHKNKQLQIKNDTENAQKLRQLYAGPSEFTLPIW